MADSKNAVVGAIRSLLSRRKGDSADTAVGLDADLYEDLELDSLAVAELSAVLEDDLGSDPYSEGLTPRTVGEVVDFYDT